MQMIGAHHPGSMAFNSTGSNFTVRLCRDMVRTAKRPQARSRCHSNRAVIGSTRWWPA